MTVTITALTEREFFAWYALFTEYAASQGLGMPDEQAMRVWTAVQQPGAVAVVAQDDGGNVVGLAHAVPFERLLRGDAGVHVEDVYVTEGARRAGVATSLVEHLRATAEAAGRPLLRWQVRADDPAARALQEHFADAAGARVLQTLPVG